MKNTLEICSFMNKILIDLIREAQENNIISISSIKPLLDAQELNENLRSDCEEKIKNILMNKTKTPDSIIYKTKHKRNFSEIPHKNPKFYTNKKNKNQEKATKKQNIIKRNGSENRIIDNSSQIIMNMLNNTSNFTIINNKNNYSSCFPMNYKSKNKYLKKVNNTIKTNNYLSRFNMLKNYTDIPSITNLFLKEKDDINQIKQIFDCSKDIISYEFYFIHIINLKNFLDIIRDVYKIREIRRKNFDGGMYTKSTIELDLYTYLKSKYGLKKLIVEWNLNILTSIKAYSKINGEVCLFGLLLKNEIDERYIEILYKIKKTLIGILRPLYEYKTEVINKIKNKKEFMKEKEWLFIIKCMYNEDNSLYEKFKFKIYEFINKFVDNEELTLKTSKKILFGDFVNQLILFNLRLRKKYLKNFAILFTKFDKNKYGIICHEDFRNLIQNLRIIENEKLVGIINQLIEKADKEGTGQITFNDAVMSLDDFYLEIPEGKIKLLDKINALKLNQY